jgi:hypothetical protein
LSIYTPFLLRKLKKDIKIPSSREHTINKNHSSQICCIIMKINSL